MVLGVFGAGGNGRMLVDELRNLPQNQFPWSEIIFVDDVIEEREFYGCRVFSFQQVKEQFSTDEIEIAITLGDPFHRESIFQMIKSAGYKLPVLKISGTDISSTAILGEGVIVCGIVGSNAVIRDNVLISKNAMVGHDTTIGEHCDISAGSFIAGHCILGKRVYMGPMAAIRDGITIGDNCIVGMSAAVYKNMEAEKVALGNPARFIKRSEQDMFAH